MVGLINHTAHIEKLVRAIKNAGIRTPIAIKLGYSDHIVALAKAAEQAGADALVLINTVGPLLDFKVERKGSIQPVLGIQGGRGGLSGSPIFHLALTAVATVSQQVSIPVIASGGVDSAERAFKMILAGAHAVQIYTAAHVAGERAPNRLSQIVESFSRLLDSLEIETPIDELRGKAWSILHQSTNITPLYPHIDNRLCVGCLKCETVCIPRAIFVHEQGYKQYAIELRHEACTGCGHCISVCPTDALQYP